jgi:L-lactate permease
MFDAPTWVAPVLAFGTGIVLPWVIEKVKFSTRKWVNLVVAYGSSLGVGVLSSWIAGDFTSDVYASLLVALGASQTAYKLYWKSLFEQKTEVPTEVTPPLEPTGTV